MSDELEKRKLTKSESWDITDEIRQGFETIHENRMAQVDRLARAYEGYAWEGLGYESFEEYKAEEFGEDLQHQRLELEERISAVKVLSDSGMAKVEIADILGIHRNSVTNLLKRIDSQEAANAQRCASTEVDAAGQRVEEVGLIDAVEFPTHIDDEPSPTVIENVEVSDVSDKTSEDDRKERLDSWLDEINFAAMILPTSNQIAEPEPEPDTPEYFTPRPAQPRPLEVIKPTLPPPPANRYDDPEPEFLEPPMKLAKVQDPNKDDTKHCRTCNCNLLP